MPKLEMTAIFFFHNRCAVGSYFHICRSTKIKKIKVLNNEVLISTPTNRKVTNTGSIPGELSFAANSRELARTRANSRELRANSPTVRQHRQSAELRRTFAGVRRTFAGVRRSSPGFARVRAHSAANSRTVRQKIRSPEEIYPPLTVVRREQVRRERSSPMANYSSPKSIFWIR